MSNSKTFVGLDVHKRQTHAAVFDPLTGEIATTRIPGCGDRVVRFLVDQGSDIEAVYEAGPLGFALHRRAADVGLDLKVCAPGLIPRKPTDKVKTDKKDAIHLARMMAAGELSFIWTPTKDEERIRQLVRARDDLRTDLMRSRHRLLKFLNSHGYDYEKSNWTNQHFQWIDRIKFNSALTEAVFIDYLSSLKALEQRKIVLNKLIEEVASGCVWSQTIARLRCFRGIDTLTAIGVCAEVGQFTRFSRSQQFASYLGMVPSEYSSGDRRQTGSITRAGSKHARRLLVEAAHNYRVRPNVTEAIRKRQEGQDPRVCEVAWRAQTRVNNRWKTLRSRKKPYGTCVIASYVDLRCVLRRLKKAVPASRVQIPRRKLVLR